LATFTKLNSGSWRAQVRRKGKYVNETFLRRKDARFIYLENQYATPEYWEALTQAIAETNPAYAAALAGMSARGGAAPNTQFHVISGSATLLKKQAPSAVILDRLKSVGLLDETDIAGVGQCVGLCHGKGTLEVNRAALRARLIAEEVLIGALQNWLGRSSRIFHVDLCGPCYLPPMRRFRGEQVDPGFVVADVVLGKSLEEHEARCFIRKCELLSYLRKVRSFHPDPHC
jgi:hypothetical protein